MEEFPDSDTITQTRSKKKTALPTLYRVILMNDDYTSMEFVVAVLETIFKKTPAEAVQVMLQVHNKGSGTAGVYPKQIAETKIAQVDQRAKEYGYPLKCIMEPE